MHLGRSCGDEESALLNWEILDDPNSFVDELTVSLRSWKLSSLQNNSLYWSDLNIGLRIHELAQGLEWLSKTCIQFLIQFVSCKGRWNRHNVEDL